LFSHLEALLMPLPSTRRSTLDSFLPQFDPCSDDLTQSGTTPHGDNGHVDVNDRLAATNGHGAVSIDGDVSVDRATGNGALAQNGAAEHAIFETMLDPSPVHVNGSGPLYTHNVTLDSHVVIEQPAEPEMPPERNRQLTDENNGFAGSSIGDALVSPAAVIQPNDQPDESVDSLPTNPTLTGSELPPHPAAGSLFTPYLVTEIRQLRNRRSRQSWWRRIFG
jgi:hypothetical protein